MNDAGPVAGPSRPARSAKPMDLAAQIVSIQRKNASSATAGPSRVVSRREGAQVDEFSRGTVRGNERMLYDPARPMPRPEPISVYPPESSRSRGDLSPRVPNGQYSPEVPLPRRRPPVNGIPFGGDMSAPHSHRREMPPPPPSIHNGPIPGPSTSRQLFDPSAHDPHQFTSRNRLHPSHNLHNGLDSPPPLPHSQNGGSSGLLRKVYRTPEEEADRERERRRRREGSERGSNYGTSITGSTSTIQTTKKKDNSDVKSRGSRSSEGSESFKDRERGKGRGDNGVKAILKDIHDSIKSIELELTEIHRIMSLDPEAGISVLSDTPRDPYSREEPTRNKNDANLWVDLISKHKELADLHHDFLVRVFDPLVPSSLHQLTIRYNIPSRLWQTGFHLILERLRYAWMSGNPMALDLLTDLVHDAYKFYTDLLEDLSLVQFRAAWIEALGDLARYRMAIASHLAGGEAPAESPLGDVQPRSNGVASNGVIDDAPVPSGASIGAEVAENWDVEDKETWRTTARDWYNMGITEKPGEGRLHHHLALLCRDVRGQEPRALHHFTKSLSVTHSYDTSRESILPLFDSALQSKRSLPEATAMDLFLRLHGMLFTKISLDNFSTVMSRFMERLEEDSTLDAHRRKTNLTLVDWIMMGSVNICAVLQYGASQGVLRKALAQESVERRTRAQAQAADEEEQDGEEGGPNSKGLEPPAEETPDIPASQANGNPIDSTTLPSILTHSLELAFAVFDFCLSHPHRQQGPHQVLNPYITLFLTFIATLSRQPHVINIISPWIPWRNLITFLNKYSPEIKSETRLITGSPIPEDWTIRGMEWVGRRVYERGFWKSKSTSSVNSGSSGTGTGRGSGGMIATPIPRSQGGSKRIESEMDVLLSGFDEVGGGDMGEGIVMDEEGFDHIDGTISVNTRRWKRVAWAAGLMLKYVNGIEVDEKIGLLEIRDPLESSILSVLAAKEKEEREEEERRNRLVMKRLALQEEEYYREVESGEESDPELAALMQKRLHLESLLKGPSSTATLAPLIPTSRSTTKKQRNNSLNVIPGYTILIFDTNVLCSSLDIFASVVESGQWTVVVPLPVITELDGLSKSDQQPLGSSAQAAVAYLESHIRTHGISLKIQTSKGNYLSDLLIRTEHHQSGGGEDDSTTRIKARTMDDLILNIASFQAEYWTDRSGLLMPSLNSQQGGHNSGATKVLLVTYDRNLRLLARARGLDSADEKDLAAVLS